MIISASPNISVEKLKERLLKSVDKIDTLSGKVASGGRLNAGRAVGSTVVPVAFTYTGFGGAVSGTPITGAANVSVDSPTRLPGGSVSMRVTLATRFGIGCGEWMAKVKR